MLKSLINPQLSQMFAKIACRLGTVTLLVTSVLASTVALAEDNPENLANQPVSVGAPMVPGVSQTELDANVSQIKSELRSQRDLTELRVNTLENKIQQTADYVERLLVAFLLAGGIVVFVVLVTLNKQSGINNEKMRNLIRESEHALNDLHRMLDRPEAEHFHVSRKLTVIMNKMRKQTNITLPQKDISDIYAAAQDPTLPVTLHLQANALKQEQAGDSREAIILWERLLGIEDNNPEVLLHLAQNYKKLAETTTGPSVHDYRKTSLEYFQQYSVRTNQHLSSAREIQKIRGETNQLPQTLVDDPPVSTANTFTAPAQTPPPPPAMPERNVEISDRPNTARSLLSDSFTTAKPIAMRKTLPPKPPVADAVVPPTPPPDVVQKPAPPQEAKPAVQVKEPPKPSAVSKPAQPPEQKVTEPAATPAKVTKPEQEVVQEKPQPATQSEPPVVTEQAGIEEATKANGKAAAQAKAIPAPKKADKPASKPADKAKAKPKPAAPKLKNKAGNGAAKATKKDKELSEVDQIRAFNSRIEKAKDYFGRYNETTSAKQKLNWLNAARDELELAESYQKNVMLYRLWGITELEISRQNKGSRDEHVNRAIELFTRGETIKAGELSNEIALCHATLNEEAECRSALETAKQHGMLNLELCNEQPEFRLYHDRDWYRDLVV